MSKVLNENEDLDVEARSPNSSRNPLESDEETLIKEYCAALRNLNSSIHFKRYGDILIKEMDRQKNQLVNLKGDDEEIHRTQGFVKGLKYALDMRYLTKHYQNKLETYANTQEEPAKSSKKS